LSPSWPQRFALGVREKLAFPLLAKELTETAARRRTYVLRVVYAVVLYGVFALMLPQETWARLSRPATFQANDFSMLGAGGEMFNTLVMLQLAGLFLFLPALMCGRITTEKERDSLVLLFLTELSPWAIVLQKYFGGLIAMFSFFLLGLPLAGVAYAFGGVETTTILEALLMLLLLCLFLGAIALLCSAWCRSTVGAFLMTYFVGAVPVALLFIFGTGPSDIGTKAYWLLFFSLALLALARRFLITRALVPPANFLRRLFERIDQTMKRLNRATGGIELWKDKGELPGDEPILWRETHSKVLGKLHYLLRLLCVVEVPTVFLCMFAVYTNAWSYSQSTFLTALLGLLSVLAALVVSVQAANSIVSERVGQSLEVLLTTPLPAREIIRQKEIALRRIVLIASVPLLTVVAAEAYSEPVVAATAYSEASNPVRYLVCAVSSILIYLRMITWLSLWISLRVRTRFQAIIAAVGTLAVWTGLVPLIFHLTEGAWRSLVILSPATVPLLNEFNQFGEIDGLLGNPWAATLANAALYWGIALFFRRRLYADAESLLRR
jgi:ABC-type transport system involved in multi-copper enzyme maturation permease subunit